ncbi:MAG: 23S rRNA (uracil(1939)-C(5))-methyltransferase RlmD [Eggerthellaceae bacterium]|nr:23S rRNA (uracil(1939)-C(5))-methyltransferase RlmD [Eggerthellaceae bacterium]
MDEQKRKPTCNVARQCGGCSHIDVAYDEQLACKNARVRELFANEFPEAEIHPILGMDAPYHYRNKVTSPFAPGKRGPNGGREILTGMYAAGTHRIVQADGCLIENEQAQQVIRAIRQIMKRHKIEPYDEDRGTGFMRHAIVRVGHESGEILVTLVTNSDEFPASKSFCRELVKKCPFITTIVQNVNLRQTNVILGEKERRLYGPGFILDALCGLSFRISSQSFYQVNAVQTEVLYEQAMKLADLGAVQAAIDAYCGTGTIGLVAAKRGAASVIGVDSVESAIRDARENARHNGIENARFTAADATSFMCDAAETGERIDVVFMDPPRAGSTPEFLDALARLAPSRVVYISCNPETQVRDLRHLAAKGYRVREIRPVDMFPHTDHIETVVRLDLVEAR